MREREALKNMDVILKGLEKAVSPMVPKMNERLADIHRLRENIKSLLENLNSTDMKLDPIYYVAMFSQDTLKLMLNPQCVLPLIENV